MYGQPCQPAATFCSSAAGSQRPRQPSGVCPGTAGRLAQLLARSARTIARRAVHSAPPALWVYAQVRLGGGLNCLRPWRGPLGGERFTAPRRPSVYAQVRLNYLRPWRGPLGGGRFTALAPALGVCPGWAVVQLFARSARIIARWGLSTRAGPRCLPKLGGSLNCMRARRESLRGGVSALAPALSVCPGTAGRRAQLPSPLARTIARRAVHSAPTALGINRSALLRLI